MISVLSIAHEPPDRQRFKTVADLCHIVGTASLPRTAAILFTLTRDSRLRSVGVELAI